LRTALTPYAAALFAVVLAKPAATSSAWACCCLPQQSPDSVLLLLLCPLCHPLCAAASSSAWACFYLPGPTQHLFVNALLLLLLLLLLLCLLSSLLCGSYIMCLGLLLPAWAFTGLDAAALSAFCFGLFSNHHVESQSDVA
jgi:hypothetical protein